MNHETEVVKVLSKGKFAVIGAGKMGEILISALLDSGSVKKEQFIATAKHQARIDVISKEYGVETTLDNAEAVRRANIVLLCVKPQNSIPVLESIRSELTENKLLISIVTSLTTAKMEAVLGKSVPVIRAIPNTPALLKAGITALSGGKSAQPADLEKAKTIFLSVGRALIVDEHHMDAVTALSASGPAFIFIIIEALAEGGVMVGLPREVATELVAQSTLGAAKMVLETGKHPALLKDQVTTPAGCTIDGILQMEEGGIRVTLIKTIVEAARRARELIEER